MDLLYSSGKLQSSIPQLVWSSSQQHQQMSHSWIYEVCFGTCLGDLGRIIVMYNPAAMIHNSMSWNWCLSYCEVTERVKQTWYERGEGRPTQTQQIRERGVIILEVGELIRNIIMSPLNSGAINLIVPTVRQMLGTINNNYNTHNKPDPQ